MEVNKEALEQVILQVLKEKLDQGCGIAGQEQKNCLSLQPTHKKNADGVIQVNVPNVRVTAADRMDTQNAADRVYTHDLFSLQESPRLGCGIMEMEKTTFDWTLNYDEIDYVMEGKLSILINGKTVTAGPGEIILIPKGSSIAFSVPDYARFLYITYPADWASQP